MRKKNPTEEPGASPRAETSTRVIQAEDSPGSRKRSASRERSTAPSEGHAETVRRLLLTAYDAGNRSLPWRGESDPYRIWVSEIMLQQTRVETVVPYYERWLESFPDIDSLAMAEEDDVLRVWQGLGYYSRARRLHQGARLVRERYGGALPRNSEELRKLPGVGEYTSGALASIAFGEAVPAVDGNVKRVLSRLFDLPSPSPGEFRLLATELVDRERPGDFNQALMELGALVCVPRSPRCDECPLGPVCLAQERGTVDERPARRPKRPVPEKDEVVLVAVARASDGGLRLLLRKRPSTGLLAGMWEFPGVEAAGAFFDAATDLAKDLGLSLTSVPASPRSHLTPMGVVTHVFSHLKVRYRPFLLRSSFPPSLITFSVSGPDSPEDTDSVGTRWTSEEQLKQIPLPVAQQKMCGMALKLAVT